jgi:hypothetical protein
MLSLQVTQEALGFLDTLFGMVDSQGAVMAARALEPLEDPGIVTASCAALAGDLLVTVRR